jgi:hypothetical protein
MELVTLKTYSYPHEMAVVRSFLESEGIMTYVMSEVISDINPFYSSIGGGIKLQVNKLDASRALAIMQEKGFLDEKSYVGPNGHITTMSKKTGNVYLYLGMVLFFALIIAYILLS